VIKLADLILAAALILVLSAAAVWCGARVGRRAGERVTVFFVATTIVLLGVFVLCLHGRLALARLLPFSGVIVLGNWIPIGAGLLGGVVLGKGDVPRRRRIVLFVVLVVMGVFSLFRPMLRTTPPATDTWSENGVCLQSNAASCSACAAATLLKHYRIESSEAEMSDLCLTNRQGTPTLGLYRGLALKTRNSSLAVRVVSSDVDTLLEEDTWPVLLLAELPDRDRRGADYAEQWGWTPGVGHAVVVFKRFAAGGFDVGDPMVGRELWTVEDLRILWHGRGLRLVPRRASIPMVLGPLDELLVLLGPVFSAD